MARIVRGPEPYAPTGGLNIFGTLLKQQLSESSQMRMMRERAGLREQMDIRGAERKKTQAFDHQTAQEKLTTTRGQYWMTPPDQRPEFLDKNVEALRATLPQHVIDTRFGGDKSADDRIRMALSRELNQAEHLEVTQRNARLKVRPAAERLGLQQKRKRTAEDLAHDRAMRLAAFQTELKILYKDFPNESSEFYDKKILRLGLKLGLPKVVREQLTSRNASKRVKALQLQETNKRILQINTRMGTNAKDLARLATELPARSITSRGHQTKLQAVYQLVTNQAALVARRGDLEKAPIKKIHPVARDMFVVRDKDGNWDTTNIYWHGDVINASEQAEQKRRFDSLKNPTSIYDILMGKVKKSDSDAGPDPWAPTPLEPDPTGESDLSGEPDLVMPPVPGGGAAPAPLVPEPVPGVTSGAGPRIAESLGGLRAAASPPGSTDPRLKTVFDVINRTADPVQAAQILATDTEPRITVAIFKELIKQPLVQNNLDTKKRLVRVLRAMDPYIK